MTGSWEFYGTVHRHDELHVYRDSSWPNHLWRVKGFDGDFGTNTYRDAAIQIAIGIARGLLFPTRIYVHDRPRFVITKVHHMTLEDAKKVAAEQTTPHLVWRMPKWPAGVYGVIAERPMPSEAEVIKVEPTGGQGSLF